MAAGSTYTPIATTTLGSATTSYTFSSIPSTYTDLILVFSGSGASTGQSLDIRLNADSGNNYSFTGLYGDGTTAGSFRVSNISYGRITNFTTAIGTSVAHFQNYANTTTYKTWISRGGTASSDTAAFVSLWRNTAAINSIQVGNIGGGFNISAGSTFTLYGIAAA